MKNVKKCIELNGREENISSYNYIQLLYLLDDLQHDYNNWFNSGKVIKKHMQNTLNEIYGYILLVKYYIQKNTSYKNIKVEINGDIDYKETTLIFPKGTRKNWIKAWLIKNEMYVNETFPINGSFDCSGQLSSEYATIKGNKAILRKTYDL